MPRSPVTGGSWHWYACLSRWSRPAPRTRTILLPPTLYLAAFVWETRLSVEPAVTRQLMIGAILIVMMNARPQGLLGQRRVEVIT